MYRISVDTGGTFTDAVLHDDSGSLWLGKGLTRLDRSWLGVRDALEAISEQIDVGLEEMLARCELFLYGTTRSTNAILTGTTVRTAFLTTRGFPDILLMREGGRLEPFNLRIEYPKPYIDRSLTFEVNERIDAEGQVVEAIDRDQLRGIIERIREYDVKAVAVCLLWSMLNPEHELVVGEMLEELAPDIPYTLSHQVNPIMREYRRASTAAIDASLKPLMERHFKDLEDDLREAGLGGDLLAFTSLGGVMKLHDLRAQPVLTVKSGPSMAPVAARAYGSMEGIADGDLIVCDTGGTSFDVSLVPSGQIKFTRETILGKAFTGYMTGLSSVDIRSIGSGGGSIAWVDPGGLLKVGPQSAGAEPGPACYGLGGEEPTVTDAAALLGYLDAETFAGGRIRLDLDAARAAFEPLAEQLGLTVEVAAHGVLTVATEDMIGAIRDITINEGVDPRESVIVAGGGAAGINVVPIARELGVEKVLMPRTAGALSASGGQYADILHEFSVTRLTDTADFDLDAANTALAEIRNELERYVHNLDSAGRRDFGIRYSVEARYPFQIWELEVPLEIDRFERPEQVEELARRFHDLHMRTFAINEPAQSVECVNWKGRLTIPLEKPKLRLAENRDGEPDSRTRGAYFPEIGRVEMPRFRGDSLPAGTVIEGPAAIDEPTTTIVLYPGSSATVTDSLNYLLSIDQGV